MRLSYAKSRWSIVHSALLVLAITCAVQPGAAMAESKFEALLQKVAGGDTAEGVYSSNGRLEVQTVDVAAKYDGRISEILADEGDLVGADDPLARLDPRDAQAQVNAAKAAVMQARASKTIAEATLTQAQSALAVARTTFDRTTKLHASGTAPQSVLDDVTNTRNSAEASVAMAKAQIEDAEAVIAAAGADLELAELVLDDMNVRAPLRGRVLYRLHEPGEVLAAGYPIMTLLDLSDVYMNIYLPASVVGTLAINDEARLVFDPIPDYVVPARVTFISPQSQFTPKNVETTEQREELVFRVKLSVPRELLSKFEEQIKSGVRGIGFVRTDPTADWPADLQVNVPE